MNERQTHPTPGVIYGDCARFCRACAFNVKLVLSFTRFKGVVTTRNHAARVPSACLSLSLWNPLKCPRFSTLDSTLPPPRRRRRGSSCLVPAYVRLLCFPPSPSSSIRYFAVVRIVEPSGSFAFARVHCLAIYSIVGRTSSYEYVAVCSPFSQAEFVAAIRVLEYRECHYRMIRSLIFKRGWRCSVLSFDNCSRQLFERRAFFSPCCFVIRSVITTKRNRSVCYLKRLVFDFRAVRCQSPRQIRSKRLLSWHSPTSKIES